MNNRSMTGIIWQNESDRIMEFLNSKKHMLNIMGIEAVAGMTKGSVYLVNYNNGSGKGNRFFLPAKHLVKLIKVLKTLGYEPGYKDEKEFLKSLATAKTGRPKSIIRKSAV